MAIMIDDVTLTPNPVLAGRTMLAEVSARLVTYAVRFSYSGTYALLDNDTILQLTGSGTFTLADAWDGEILLIGSGLKGANSSSTTSTIAGKGGNGSKYLYTTISKPAGNYYISIAGECSSTSTYLTSSGFSLSSHSSRSSSGSAGGNHCKVGSDGPVTIIGNYSVQHSGGGGGGSSSSTVYNGGAGGGGNGGKTMNAGTAGTVNTGGGGGGGGTKGGKGSNGGSGCIYLYSEAGWILQ